MFTLFIANTQKKAQEVMARTTVQCCGPEDFVDAVGVGGACYSTPHKVFFCEEIPFNERTYEWLTRDVHLGSFNQEVRWVHR